MDSDNCFLVKAIYALYTIAIHQLELRNCTFRKDFFYDRFDGYLFIFDSYMYRPKTHKSIPFALIDR